MSKIEPLPRGAYKHVLSIQTRWNDNDVYGHVNNVVYYEFFDTAVNKYLIDEGVLNIHHSDIIGLVVETQCNYFAPAAYPDELVAGIRVGKLGNSSVRYEIGLFIGDDETPAAQGHFVHVYVDRETRRPAPLSGNFREALMKILSQQH